MTGPERASALFILFLLLAPPLWSLVMYNLFGYEATLTAVARSYMKAHNILIGLFAVYMNWVVWHVVTEYQIP